MENTNLKSAMTISQAIDAYLVNIKLTRSAHTTKTYHNALNHFEEILSRHKVSPTENLIGGLKEDTIGWYAGALKEYSAATEQLYLVAVKGFFEFLAAENLAEINLPRLRLLIRQRSRRPGIRLPQFPRDNIDILIEYTINIANYPAEDETDRLRNLRDRAFLLTLADTGLRVHEACGLRRGEVDWNEGIATIIGKGNREAVVRFSNRALSALRDYINARAKLDGASGRPLTTLPLFARHDNGAGKKIKPITTATGRNIVALIVEQALGPEAVGSITPHSLRHYFVTTILRASGNLKLAQELARHQNITVTQRYAHLSDDELDKGYHEIFK
jgi:site-specific recombinase XerD